MATVKAEVLMSASAHVGSLTQGEFDKLTKGSRMKVKNLEALRLVFVEGMRAIDAARQVGISRQNLDMMINRMAEKILAKKYGVRRDEEMPLPCNLCQAELKEKCQRGGYACQAFAQYVNCAKFNVEPGSNFGYRHWRIVFPRSQIRPSEPEQIAE